MKPVGWQLVRSPILPQLKLMQNILLGYPKASGEWHWWFCPYLGEYWFRNTPELQGIYWAYIPDWIENGTIAS